jgi:two-component sensor histidine kinase
VKRYEILDTAPEPAFDRFAALAAGIFDAPMALIGFIDGERLWLKSHHGIAVPCPSASVDDLQERIRRDHHFDFFVATPLLTRGAQNLGMVSVIDRESRQATPMQYRNLQLLAEAIVDHLELRLSRLRAAAGADIRIDEANHRLLNNLQFVSSWLRLQSALHEDNKQLLGASHRIKAAARIHAILNGKSEQTEALAFLRRLCTELSKLVDFPIGLGGDEAILSRAQMFAVGVITNELVTNACKHGAPPIGVTFTRTPSGMYELSVVDAGLGISPRTPEITPSPGGLGMTLVAGLVQDLEGKLSALPNPNSRGACISVVFPPADKAAN